MLQVYAYQNPFKPSEDKDQYCFRSVVDETVDGERLVREIAQYNSTITEADARAVLAVLDDRVRHFVRLGYKVELPFGTVFKPGALLRLRGRHVSFDANDAAQGVFVRAQGGERLRIGRYTRIGSNVVEGFIPDDLAAGSYEVTLVTKPGLRRYEQGVCSTRITVE